MKFLSIYQKLFIISALCTVLVSSSAIPSDTSTKPVSLLDETESTVLVYDNKTSFTRDKRWFTDLGMAQFGTNWCLDQITDLDSHKIFGLYYQTDKCCKQLVQCTNNEKKFLLEDYPEKTNEIKNEIFRSCACDEEFDDCLHDVIGIFHKAKAVGKYYFQNLARFCRNDKLERVRNLRFYMNA